MGAAEFTGDADLAVVAHHVASLVRRKISKHSFNSLSRAAAEFRDLALGEDPHAAFVKQAIEQAARRRAKGRRAHGLRSFQRARAPRATRRPLRIPAPPNLLARRREGDRACAQARRSEDIATAGRPRANFCRRASRFRRRQASRGSEFAPTDENTDVRPPRDSSPSSATTP